jgi:uncharacterized protein
VPASDQGGAGAEGSGHDAVLRAPHVLEYTYHRSVGPVIGAFLTGLRNGEILGTTGAKGTVIVPPTEYDPITGQDTHDMVRVGTTGTVTTWAWAAHPLADQPLDRPFAWALIKLDQADTALLHVVDAGSPDAMHTGMRVHARFAPEAERRGHVRDIECFVPEAAS